jgi:hypothetical protein
VRTAAGSRQQPRTPPSLHALRYSKYVLVDLLVARSSSSVNILYYLLVDLSTRVALVDTSVPVLLVARSILVVVLVPVLDLDLVGSMAGSQAAAGAGWSALCCLHSA